MTGEMANTFGHGTWPNVISTPACLSPTFLVNELMLSFSLYCCTWGLGVLAAAGLHWREALHHLTFWWTSQASVMPLPSFLMEWLRDWTKGFIRNVISDRKLNNISIGKALLSHHTDWSLNPRVDKTFIIFYGIGGLKVQGCYKYVFGDCVVKRVYFLDGALVGMLRFWSKCLDIFY